MFGEWRPFSQRWIHKPLIIRDKNGRPQEDSLAVHTVCSGSALLGDRLGVSRSRKCDLLSVLSIYPRIFLHVFIVYHLLLGVSFCVVVFYYIFMCVGCFSLVVSTCQVFGWKDSSDCTFM